MMVPTILANFLIIDLDNHIVGYKNHDMVPVKTNFNILFEALEILWLDKKHPIDNFPLSRRGDEYTVNNPWILDPIICKMLIEE